MSLKDLERETGLSRKTIYRRVAAGFFRPCSQPGKKLQFRRREVVRAMENAERMG